MSRETQKKNPDLRFPEFNDHWKCEILKDVAIFRNGKAHEQLIGESGLYTVINSRFISTEGLIEKFSNHQLVPVQEKDITMVMSDVPNGKALAKCFYVDANNKFTLNQRICSLTAESINSLYLFYLLNRNKYFLAFDSGVSQTNLRKEDVLRCPIASPSIKEQEKIAGFLGAVDARLGQLRRKHELLQTYKRGVMQKLFSQQIRFKQDDGSDFPDWEKKKFGEVFKRVKRRNAESNSNVLTISAQFGLINQREFFNKSVAAQDLSGYYLLKRGDFAYNKSYSKGYPMGALKRLKKYDKGVVSSLYICFSTMNETNAIFYEQYFDGGFLNRELSKIAQEGARNHGLLNMSVVDFFKDIKINYPHCDEQKKIADFLASLDQRIAAIAAQIERNEKFKEGLLQKMFV